MNTLLLKQLIKIDFRVGFWLFLKKKLKSKITAFEFKRSQSKLSKNTIFDKIHRIGTEFPVNLSLAFRLSSNNAILTNREEDNHFAQPVNLRSR